MEDLTISQLETMIDKGTYAQKVNATIELNARLCVGIKAVRTFKRIDFLEDAKKVQSTVDRVKNILDRAKV